MDNFELLIIQEFQKHSFLTQVMQFLSDEGYRYAPILIPIALVFISRSFGIRLAVLYAASHFLTLLLKLSIQRPRPYWVSEDILQLGSSSGYAMPSGHTLIVSTLLIGFSTIFHSRWIRTSFIFLAIAIGLSRIYLGVHWPSDVIVGIFLAFMLIYASKPLCNWLIQWRKKFSANYYMGIQILLLVVFAVLASFTLKMSENSPSYQHWQNFIHFHGVYRSFGSTLGIVSAVILGERLFRYQQQVSSSLFIKSIEFTYMICGYFLFKDLFLYWKTSGNELAQAGASMMIQALLALWVIYGAQYITRSAENFFPNVRIKET